MIVTQIIGTGITAGFMPDDTSDTYPKVVKVNSEKLKEESDEKKDAVGQVVRIGDRIACRKPIEAAGNTLKGFEKGGVVTKITAHYAFYTEDETGAARKKGLNGIVVY